MNHEKLVNEIAIEKGIKVCYHYGNDYNKLWVYIPRIYNNNPFKAKVRVLKDSDKVKNCLKITFDVERYDKADIEYLIRKNKRVIQNHLQGTCQTFITITSLTKILTGIVQSNGKVNQEFSNRLKLI